MIHIATVHWQDARFVDVQLEALARHVGEPFRVYTFLNGIDAAYRTRFHYASQEPIMTHGIKLNLLADVVRFNAEPTDLLIFMDGDAWPIAPFVPWVRQQLKVYPLIAVGQPEAPTQSELHPHPSFAVTTVGFWHEVRGDWKEGRTWTVTVHGKAVERTDTGANLMGQLRDRGAPWLPLTRTNTVNLNPLFFGVYGTFVYHHGAGFRQKITIPEILAINDSLPASKLVHKCARPIQRLVFSCLGHDRLVRQRSQRNLDLSRTLFEAVRRDPLFPFNFIDPEATEERVIQRAHAVCGSDAPSAPAAA